MSRSQTPVVLKFKVFDSARERSQTIETNSLNDLIMQASEALGLPVARVCLEQDGTEVDEEEYFSTLDQDTPLMVLAEDDTWLPVRYQLLIDEMNRGGLRRSSGAGRGSTPDLEALGNMDPDCHTDICLAECLEGVPDRVFLEAVRDACQACRPACRAATPPTQPQPQREAVNSM